MNEIRVGRVDMVVSMVHEFRSSKTNEKNVNVMKQTRIYQSELVQDTEPVRLVKIWAKDGCA